MLTNILEPPVQSHLKKVYTCLSMSTVAACIGSYVHVFTNILQGSLITSFLALLLAIPLFTIPPEPKKQNLRLALLLGFSFLTGLGMGPLIDLAIMIDPSLVATAFLGTSVAFVAFTLSAMYNRNKMYLYMGGILMSVMTMLLFVGIMNIFVQSMVINKMFLYISLAASCAFVLYDTQLIIDKRRCGDSDYIGHTLLLFMDFADMFRYLLIILLQSQDTKKRRKKDRD